VGLLVGVLVEAGERLVERPALDGQCQELAALSSPVRCLKFLHGAVVAAADKRCKHDDDVILCKRCKHDDDFILCKRYKHDDDFILCKQYKHDDDVKLYKRCKHDDYVRRYKRQKCLRRRAHRSKHVLCDVMMTKRHS